MGKLKREFFSVINGVLPKSLTFRNYGRSWKIPNVPKSMDRLMRPGRELMTGEWVRDIVPDANLIIDIGANVGQSLVLYRSLYPAASYIGFEPNPVCAAVLCRLIALNELRDAQIYTVGISTSFGAGDLMVNRSRMDDPSATLVLDCHTDAESRMSVPGITGPLRMFMPDLEVSSRTIIKIDVEGFEADVLESLAEIAEQRPVIVSEVLASWAGGKNSRERLNSRLQDWITRHRYSIVAVGHGQIEEIDPGWEAYIFVPAELESRRTRGVSAEYLRRRSARY